MMNTYKGVVAIAINQEGFGYKHYNLNYAGNVFMYLRVPSILISVLILCSIFGHKISTEINTAGTRPSCVQPLVEHLISTEINQLKLIGRYNTRPKKMTNANVFDQRQRF
jgi:hypothetical protein